MSGPPAGWDEVFGDLDARTLTPEERLDFVNRQVELAVGESGWTVRGGGLEAELVWHDALRCYVDGLWIACILCCHAVCEREVAGVIAISPANLNDRIGKKWESFGLGRLLHEVKQERLLPHELIEDLRLMTDLRKPYGHWRGVTDIDALDQRIRREASETGHQDRLNLVERLIVRDATRSIVTTARLFFGNFALGGK